MRCLERCFVTLIFRPPQLQAMKAHAEQTYPEECCGLLLGQYDAAHDRAHVHEIRLAHNDWTEAVNPFAEADRIHSNISKRNRFWIDPKLLLTTQRECRDRGWIIVGVYHSHPDHPALPSERDRQLAWSSYAYPILSVTAHRVTEVLSWRLNDHGQFEADPILCDGAEVQS